MNINSVALVGNPNAGKTTVFNLLTGLNQKVGNYPGVTIDKKSGSFKGNDGSKIQLVDLPGIYSLDTQSEDERVVSLFLSDKSSKEFPDLFIVVADASNLERSLLLFTELYDLKLPVMLVLNMIDVANQEGIKVDHNKLSSLLGGVPVVAMDAKDGRQAGELKEAILSYEIPDQWQPFMTPKELNTDGEEVDETEERYKKIGKLLRFCTSISANDDRISKWTLKVDRIVTHPILGYAIFLSILFLLFQAIYELATIPMDLIDGAFSYLSGSLRNSLPEGVFTDLVVEGVVPGLGGVLIFIPQIALLFLFLSVLEETGYMTRVVFIMDRIMRPFGLHGKSVVPLISGVACAIPAVMAARTIDQPKDRLITILVTPLMSCSARLPVYALMIALVIPSAQLWGMINLQGLVLLGMYLLGLVAALIVAIILKWIFKSPTKSFLIMEMPIYRKPKLRNTLTSLLEKVKVFVIEAGKIIMAISILLWVLGSYGPGSFNTQDHESTELVSKVDLEESYIGILGKQIEPAIQPLGYDWKIGIALITSFAAREVFVGTMATIYNVGEEFEEDGRLIVQMKNHLDANGKKVFDLATGLSLMVFYAFAMQCMSTLAVVKRETKTWKWPIIQFGYMTLLAYFSSLLVYNLAV